MSTHLDLPPERDLPEARRHALRAELARAVRPATRPSHRRLAVAPAIALAAAAVVVLGVTRAPDLNAPVVGVPTTTPRPDQTPGASSTASPPRFPTAPSIDRGPLSAVTANRLASECFGNNLPGGAVAQTLFARRTSTSGDVVLYVGQDGTTYACADGGPALGGGPGTPPRPEPTREHPVFPVIGPASSGDESPDGDPRTTSSTYYRLGPEVASLQLRLTVDGRTGPWFEASTAGGYAWAAASVDRQAPAGDLGSSEPRVEDRAFDAEGRLLPIVHPSR